MAGRLAGKTAFITAAAQGMGRGRGARFRARRARRVWATDLNAQKLTELDGKEGIRTRALDVTDEAAIAKVAQEVGDIDVLFNCAGIVHHGSILDATVKDWDQAFDVNVKSMFLVTRAFLPGMLKKRQAARSSTWRRSPRRSAACRTASSTARARPPSSASPRRSPPTTSARASAATRSAPGTVDTPSLQGRINAFADPVQARKDFVARQPMGRLGTVDDIMGILVFLASDESLFATGNAYSIDGGMTI